MAATETTRAGAERRKPEHWWRLLGPGLIKGASDDDPSGIATYLQVGAQFGYGLLWTLPFSLPLMRKRRLAGFLPLSSFLILLSPAPTGPVTSGRGGWRWRGCSSWS